ncbi:MAG TPA: hypothetical protein VD866_31820 [Urbifossiella sp.]|nr:hypothetical protein [Urbifossiella sp.]
MTDPASLVRAAALAVCALGSFVPRPLPERSRPAFTRPAAQAAWQVRRRVVQGRQRRG